MVVAYVRRVSEEIESSQHQKTKPGCMDRAEGHTPVDGHEGEGGLVLLEGRALGGDGGVDRGDPGSGVGPFRSDGERLGSVELEMVEERGGVVGLGRSRGGHPKGEGRAQGQRRHQRKRTKIKN